MSSFPAKRESGMEADPAKRGRFELAASSLPAQPASRMGADAEAEKDVVHAQLAELPVEIVSKIQARLPLESLVRSRAVCKAWNAAVTSPILLRERLASRGGAPEPWMLFVAGLEQSGVASCAYDPASDSWYRTRLPPWLRHLKVIALKRERAAGPAKGVVELPPMSEGGGVLLCASYRKGEGTVTFPHLGNPLVSSWICLPEFPGSGTLPVWRVLGMSVDATARCFKLVALCLGRGRLGHVGFPTFVFDSALGKWSETTRSIPGSYFMYGRPGRGVVVGTVLYCGYVLGKLLAYDLERGSWSLLDVATPALFDLFYANLVSVRGRLLCVALGRGRGSELYQGPDHARRLGMSVWIWELNFAGMTWVPVDTMPASMFDFFVFHPGPSAPDSVGFNSQRIKAVAGQDVVYVMQENVDRIAALDLRSRPPAWSWLPSCPYTQNFEFRGMSIQCLDPWLQFGSWKLG